MWPVYLLCLKGAGGEAQDSERTNETGGWDGWKWIEGKGKGGATEREDRGY